MRVGTEKSSEHSLRLGLGSRIFFLRKLEEPREGDVVPGLVFGSVAARLAIYDQWIAASWCEKWPARTCSLPSVAESATPALSAAVP